MDANGNTKSLTYDAVGRVVSILYADGTRVTFVYDAVGRRMTMQDSSGNTTYAYDDRGLMTGKTLPGNLLVTMSYDGVGNRTLLQDQDGGKPFGRDNKLGWPYPQSCHGIGSNVICSTTDEPTDSATMYGCNDGYFDQTDFITCICCDQHGAKYGSAKCFKCRFIHAIRPPREPFCEHWGPTPVSDAESRNWCSKGL